MKFVPSAMHRIKQIRIFRVVIRFKRARRYYKGLSKTIIQWALKDTEDSNFYYDLADLNKSYLINFIATSLNVDADLVRNYYFELERDAELIEHFATKANEFSLPSEIEFKFGRRAAWYVIVRCLKPKIVIETGVDHGVGSCLISAAIIRNQEEGNLGRYFGTDIRISAGELYSGRYRDVGEILFGDSISSLENFPHEIDLFINDSDHSTEYEYLEYQAIKCKLSSAGVILGDNSHASEMLLQFSKENGRKFFYFGEIPKDHWYPGAGIGLSTR